MSTVEGRRRPGEHDEQCNNSTATDGGYVMEECQACDQYVVSPGTGERILSVCPPLTRSARIRESHAT
jgi:hypothetical protein